MTENKKPFDGLKVPEPPESLRDQVLSRAREAMEAGPRPDVWSRIWESRTARVAWGTSILALAVGHLAVPQGVAAPAAGQPTLARIEPAAQEELADIINLPRISFDALPMAGLGERQPEPETVSEENES